MSGFVYLACAVPLLDGLRPDKNKDIPYFFKIGTSSDPWRRMKDFNRDKVVLLSNHFPDLPTGSRVHLYDCHLLDVLHVKSISGLTAERLLHRKFRQFRTTKEDWEKVGFKISSSGSYEWFYVYPEQIDEFMAHYSVLTALFSVEGKKTADLKKEVFNRGVKRLDDISDLLHSLNITSESPRVLKEPIKQST